MFEFTKLQGIGNDFVFYDALKFGPLTGDLPTIARSVCDRRLGVGGDGLILIEAGESTSLKMRMFNPDGSLSEMCGNGLRCFAHLAMEHGHTSEFDFPVETGAGLLHVHVVAPGQYAIDMGTAYLTRAEIGMLGDPAATVIEQPITDLFAATAVSMGNPHLVIFVDDVESIDVAKLGPELEHHPDFPSRTNVHFVQVLSRTHLKMRIWERGAGMTLACGTGACSVGVAGFLTGRSERDVTVSLPGGDLRIEYTEEGRVTMTGPAETVFEGVWPS